LISSQKPICRKLPSQEKRNSSPQQSNVRHQNFFQFISYPTKSNAPYILDRRRRLFPPFFPPFFAAAEVVALELAAELEAATSSVVEVEEADELVESD